MFLFPEDTAKKENNNHCRTCKFRAPLQCGGTVIQYCAVRKSNRTWNGKLKIKCKTPACVLYKKN